MKVYDSECLCDFAGSKRRLNELFFPEHVRAIIRRNSRAYEDFWNFLSRLQRRLQPRCAATEGAERSCLLYNKRSRLNIRTTNYRLEDYLRHREVERTSKALSRENLYCFHIVFDMYYDFLQKQKLTRIVKLRRDQAALPMAAFRTDLLNLLATHQTVVVAGDTGCGKSTQVPQYLLNGELDANDQPCGKGYEHIAVTQPRRIACISLAARVSSEMLNERGSKVGYQVRFERSRTKATQILFITEGLLLRQMQLDPFLKSYDALVLDEVHERHWQTDCLLGLVKCLVAARPQLRVVLMSATINVNLFSSFFSNCPIIQVPGRLFPIDLKYVPLTPGEIAESGERLDPRPYLRLMQRIDTTYPATERGDLLIFVPGMADIQAIMEPAKVYAEDTKRWIILPLHSALSIQDQEKVFHVAPDGVRKCILSTNIAETSLTIDGIRFVADSGRVKELSWDASARMRRLKEFPISKASADQRKGRAGRTGPGVCFRLFTQEDYDAFEPFNTPEIRRVPLETLTLQMMVMGLPDVRKFPFIEAPDPKSLDEALERLQSHGALTETKMEPQNKGTPVQLMVTPLGQLLSDLPVEFSLGRMLIMASLLGIVEPVLSLVAGMSVQSPLLPMASLSGADQARRTEALAEYESDHGDAFTILNVFDEWLRIKSESAYESDARSHRREGSQDKKDSRTDSRRWCRRIGAQEQRLHEMVRLRCQFSGLLRDAGLWTNPTDRKARNPGIHHRKDLNRARRTERIQTKRRRILTLQENEDGEPSSDSDPENDNNQAARLRKWLAAASGSSRTGNLDSLNISVRDLELVLCYDLSGLAEYASRHSHMTQADLLLLKVVLAGGLYPNLAVADPANAYRVANRGGVAGPGAEMIFHTRSKGFVTLHPNDIFVRNPDALFPNANNQHWSRKNCSKKSTRQSKGTGGESDSDAEGSEVQQPLPSGYACDHQILVYLDLMETTKPFLLNTLRVPALPTLLLYARDVDTNWNATRIVFDSWLVVDLADVEAAQRALATAVWLRTTLERLMMLQLKECAQRREQHSVRDSGDTNATTGELARGYEGDPEVQLECRRLKRVLGHSLAAFLAGTPGGPHTLRRLLAADVKQLFRRNAAQTDDAAAHGLLHRDNLDVPEPDELSGLTINTLKGGYRVNSYLTVDSLYPEDPRRPTHKFSSNEPVSDEEEETVEDSQNLALRLLRHSSRAFEDNPGSSANVGGDSSHSSADEGMDENRIKCEKCGTFIPVGTSVQTAILRHRNRCPKVSV
ncbi:unnamed protein product [Calicophoron daubneyi]|uniref:ATP-dependent RNA helicase DHX34 n=1 Tax=Calicophoron daubneyi TaxID=300641 RepID=A0AAV2TFJ9_CALDB